MIFLQIILSVIFSIIWFLIVLSIAKVTVGKEAKFWQIMLFLTIAGPLGWATILIILVYDVVSSTFGK